MKMKHPLFNPKFTRSKLFVLVIMIALILLLSPFVFLTFGGQKHDPYERIEEKDVWLNIDADNDGLSDTAEGWSGTDPTDPDTDDDGMTDGVEYQYWSDRMDENDDYHPQGDIDGDSKTNINDADSDGDGLKDGWELGSKKYDPAKKDTDGNGISDFFEEHPITGDHDNNGLPDQWENMNGVYDPNGDPDNDGIINLMEYILGQDPHRPGTGMIRPGNSDVGSMEDAAPLSVVKEIFRTDNANAPRYWRLKCYSTLDYDYYDRVQWSGGSYYYYDTIQGIDLTREDCYRQGNDTYKVEFYGLNSGNLLSPLYPETIYNIDENHDMENDTYYSDGELNLWALDDIVSYDLRVSRPDYDIKDIREHYSPGTSDQWYWMNEEYYSLDSYYLPEEITELGNNLLQDCKSTYEIIESILEYLYEHHVYSGNSTANIKEFLFDGQGGNSYHFTTAFILLARSMDVPARFVSGFAVGGLDNGYRLFTMEHLHTWAEVYFSELGWVGVECAAANESTTTNHIYEIDGNDPWILEADHSGSGFALALGGTGGTAFERNDIDYSDIVEMENLDSDMDGVSNADDEDDDNDGLSDELELDIGSNPLYPDTDRDGLADSDEYHTYGTDILDRDTDGDGLFDGSEVHKYDTDPTNDDTDEGGASDGIELYHGTDPKDPDDDDWAVDSDGDGLTDGHESKIGSDPQSRDTDGGGISDYWEVHYGFDPTDPVDDLDLLDSDGDGLKDGVELEIGSDPYEYDTDNGGAGDLSEYRYGGNLTDSGDDGKYKDSDYDGLPNFYEDEIGTNKHDSDSDGGGLSDSYEVLHGLDPLDHDDDDLLDSDSDGLSDLTEMSAGSDPYDPDSDNDGLSDYLEITEHFTKPYSADSDNDGLSDLQEISLGTDPLDRDSDDDGASDSLEIRYGSDPNEWDSDGDGVNDGEELGVDSYNNNDYPFLDDFEDWVSDPTLMDSDGDGLSDYLEMKEFDTDPLLPDSDSDGFSDFWEWDHDWDPSKMDIKSLDGIKKDIPEYEKNKDHFSHNEDFFEEEFKPRDTPSGSGLSPGSTDFDTPGSGGAGLGGMDGNLLMTIVIAFLAIAAVVGYWYYLKKRYTEELKEVFKTAIEELDARKGDVRGTRQAIINTYKRTLHILEKYRFLKHRAHTPREFARAFESALPAGGKHLNELTDVFEEARYSDHRMRERHRRRALRCLKDLYGELTEKSRDDKGPVLAAKKTKGVGA